MKNSVNQISEKAKEAIQIYLRLNEKFRNSYFWSSPSGASSRRSYEQKNSFEYEDEKFSLSFQVSCSCRNIYVSRNVMIDGVKKTAAALKKYVK